jgi:hypothetical protein
MCILAKQHAHGQTSRIPNVHAISDMEYTLPGSIIVDDAKVNAFVQSYPIQPPAIGQLLITKRHGLASDDPASVILDQPFGAAYHIEMGDQISLPTSQGQSHIHVHGLSFDINHDNLLCR